jgi:cell wall-associated NlpC family hydrolase
MHVGILLLDNKIVHASGKVRIDTANTEALSTTKPASRLTAFILSEEPSETLRN